MRKHYNYSYRAVNNQGCLTSYNRGCSLHAMDFNERLKLARNHAGLTQKALVEKLGRKADGNLLMSQANLAKMEKNPRTKGSMFTVVIAKACGVDPEWLASGVGEMLVKQNSSNNFEQARETKEQFNGVKQVVHEYFDERDRLILLYEGLSQSHKKDLMMMAEAWYRVDNPQLLPTVELEETTPVITQRKRPGM
jgi:transcriptional regulator with XRE-family HTH domain